MYPEKKARLALYCEFLTDDTEETGGAIFNAGALDILSSVLVENTATDGGLAIKNVKSPSTVVLWNVTFDRNRLECPSLTYRFAKDVSTII